MTELEIILRTFYSDVGEILSDQNLLEDEILEKIEKAYNKTFSRLK